jgi:hypothetical protein
VAVAKVCTSDDASPDKHATEAAFEAPCSAVDDIECAVAFSSPDERMQRFRDDLLELSDQPLDGKLAPFLRDQPSRAVKSCRPVPAKRSAAADAAPTFRTALPRALPQTRHRDAR